jgi:PAS domain S-box-containing protein
MKNESSVRHEPDPSIEKKLVMWLFIALAIVAFMATAAIQNDTRHAESAEQAKQANNFVQETEAVLSSLYAAEAAESRHFLTGDDLAKKTAADNFAWVEKRLKTATTMAFETPEQLDRLGRISLLLQKRLELNKEAARLNGGQGPVQATKLFTTVEARADFRELERLVAANRAIENRVAQKREETLQRHTRRTEQILCAGAGLTLLLLGVAFYVVRLDMKARRAAVANLEGKIKEKTDELNELNERLQIEDIEQQWGQAALDRIVGHHELVLNSIREAVFVITKNGMIVSANPAAADMTRREAKQLVGKLINSVLLDADRLPFPWEKHFLRSPIKDGQPVPPKAATVRQADGSLLDVQMACYPTRDRQNLTGAVVTVARNHLPMQ